ncbi:hypothetical protein [Spongorhabdus nitratireducens]
MNSYAGIAAGLILFSGSVVADGISVGLGSLGVGGQYVHTISDSLDVRLAVSGYNYDRDVKPDSLKYKAELELMGAGAVLDYRPWQSGFRVSAGVYHNGNNFSAKSKGGTGTVKIGGTTYNLNNVGTLKAQVDYKSVATYVGMGYDWRLGDSWSMTADAGAYFQGNPSVKFKASGAVAAADLEKEKKELKDWADKLKVYPLLQLNLMYSF